MVDLGLSDSPSTRRDGVHVSIDPFCSFKVVGLNGYVSKAQRTCVRKKTTTPRWDEVFQFDVLGGDRLEVQVRSKAILTSGVLIGSGSVNLHDLLDGHKHDIAVSLLPQGSVALRLQFIDESCLFGLPLADVCAREVCHPDARSRLTGSRARACPSS
jgi:Ca2+-dependent lipid-binding protein